MFLKRQSFGGWVSPSKPGCLRRQGRGRMVQGSGAQRRRQDRGPGCAGTCSSLDRKGPACQQWLQASARQGSTNTSELEPAPHECRRIGSFRPSAFLPRLRLRAEGEPCQQVGHAHPPPCIAHLKVHGWQRALSLWFTPVSLVTVLSKRVTSLGEKTPL